MNKEIKIIVIFLVFVVVMFIALQLIGRSFITELVQDVKIESPSVGLTHMLLGNGAPSGVVTTLSGQTIDTSKYFGTPFIVVFWATWNQGSVDQMVALDSYYAKTVVASPNLLVVATQENRDMVEAYLKRGGYTLPVLIDENGSFGEAYGISSLPTTFFVDKKGIISDIKIGVADPDRIHDWLLTTNK